MFEPGRDQAAGLRQLFAPPQIQLLPIGCGSGDALDREAVEHLVGALRRAGRRPLLLDFLDRPSHARSNAGSASIAHAFDLTDGFDARSGSDEFVDFLHWLSARSAREGVSHDVALVAAEPLRLADLTGGLADSMVLLARDGDRGVAQTYSQIKALRLAHGLTRYYAAFSEPRSRASAVASHRRLADTAALYLGASIEYGGVVNGRSDRSSWDRFAEAVMEWTIRVVPPIVEVEPLEGRFGVRGSH